MWTKLDYNKKCYLMLGGVILFLYLGYKFSFSDTFVLKSEINEKEEKLIWLKEKEKELPTLRAKMNEFEKAYTKGDSISVRDKLTSYISEFADENSCLVTEIPGTSLFNKKNIQVQTNTFTIKGNYKDLLTLLHTLETKHRYLARIMSAKFYTIKDQQAKKKNLYLTIITQSFEHQTL
ncbi:MAG: hypothetical protein ACK50A_00040 [Sphingobacteriaceae bacterium]